jgi:hypothetical protein
MLTITKKNKGLVILSAVTVVMLLLSLIVTQTEKPITEAPVTSGRFLKELQGNVDKVGAVILKQQGKQLKVKMLNGSWVIDGKYDYPVDVEKFRSIVVNAEKLEIAEKKTDDKTKLESLGLGDPDSATAKNPRIIFMDEAGAKVYGDFVRGNEQVSGKVKEVNGLYVRNTKEDQAWLAEGEFPIVLDANTLLNKKVFAVDSQRIKKAVFKPLKLKQFEVTRAEKGPDFKLTNPKKDGKDGNYINKLGGALAEALQFADVAPQGAITFDRKALSSVSFETFDGMIIDVIIGSIEGGNWAMIHATATSDSAKNSADEINSIADKWVYRLSDEASKVFLANFESL